MDQSAPVPPERDRRVRVATWNLHLGRDRHGDPFDVVDGIERLGADVVLVQERWRPDRGEDPLQGLDLHAEELVVARATPVGGEVRLARGVDPGTGTWSIGILTRFPVRSRRVLELGRVPTDPGARRALQVELDLGDRTVSVVVTHLSHRVPAGAWQLVRLGRSIDRDRPTLLGGDLNLWGPLVDRSLPGWSRARAGRTYPAHRPRHGIDHLLVAGGGRLEGAAVAAVVGSDHLPVVATLVLP